MRQVLGSKLIWLLLMGIALLLWWFNGGIHKLDVVKMSATGLGKEFLAGMKMQEYQFYPASNPKIHVGTSNLNIVFTVADEISTLAGGPQPPTDYAETVLSLVSCPDSRMPQTY